MNRGTTIDSGGCGEEGEENGVEDDERVCGVWRGMKSVWGVEGMMRVCVGRGGE